MTSLFDALQESPQTGVSISDVSFDERSQVRQIEITRSNKSNNGVSAGSFESVTYLVGDEREAAHVFTDANSDALEKVSFRGANRVVRSLDREVYDWVLHALDRRRIQKYDTVVIEYRPEDDLTWCISRQTYEEHTNRRYGLDTCYSARVEGTLLELYLALLEAAVGDLDIEITESPGLEADTTTYPSLTLDEPVVFRASGLSDRDEIGGDSRYVLDALRVDDRFDVVPTETDGELAVEAYGFTRA